VNAAAASELARRGELYPAVILHGGDEAARQGAALSLARTLLCTAQPEARPCGVCRHCRRIAWPEGAGEAAFHPDLQVLERDLKTATSVEATRELLKTAQVSPFEARGQVFVIANAETLSPEAANALLKALEEPHVTSPRNFFLLAPSSRDLLPTLRSRALAVYLGPAAAVDPAAVEPIARRFAAALAEYARTGASVYLLAAAEALAAGQKFDDPRAGRPWANAAAAVLAGLPEAPGAARQGLALAEDLLGAPAMRLRGIGAERILEGLVARHFG
jgi:DNA polymerase-3 subunit delta'